MSNSEDACKALIAHVRACDLHEQTLKEHLEEASRLAGVFAAKIGLEEAGKIIGLLHDFGKASVKFNLKLF